MKKVIAALLILTIMVVVGLIFYVRSVDFNQYRDLVVQRVEKVTGRKLNIAGKLDVEVSLRPSLSLSEVSFANAPWGSSPNMAKIGNLQARVALIPLVFGNLQLERIILEDAEILLERDIQGRGNWEFGKRQQTDRTEQEKAIRLPSIGTVELRNIKIIWLDEAASSRRVLQLNRVSMTAEKPADPMEIVLEGKLNDERILISGKVSPYADLIAREPLSLKLRTELTGNHLELEGSIKDPRTGRGLSIAFNGSGDDLSGLSHLTGTDLPKRTPWKLTGWLADVEDGFAINGLESRLGANDLAGGIRLIRQKVRMRVEGQLTSDHLDLTQFIPETGTQQASKKRQPKQARKKFFSSEPLPLEGLRSFDAGISFRAGEVITPKLNLQGFYTELELKGGKLSLKPLEMDLAGSRVEGMLQFDASAEIPELTLNLTARDFELGTLLQQTLGSEPLSGKTNFAIDIRGSGRSVAEVMAGLNGNTSLLVGKGRARVKKVDQVAGGLGNLLGTLVAKNSNTAVMNCLASDFEIRKGVANSRLLVVDTEVSTLSGKGTLNLGTEVLDLVVQPTPKTTTLSVAVPVEIRGTLANPTYTPVKMAALRKIAGVAALVTGAGAVPVLMGLGETGGEANPCLKIASGKAPADTQKPKIMQNVKGTLKDIGGKLKGLFKE